MNGQTPRHLDPHVIAVLFDPEGGEHPCYELSNRYMPSDPSPMVWCAGMVARGVGDPCAELAERIWTDWFKPMPYVSNTIYERQERSFAERFEP